MDETRLALSRSLIHNILWNRREFLFSLGTRLVLLLRENRVTFKK